MLTCIPILSSISYNNVRWYETNKITLLAVFPKCVVVFCEFLPPILTGAPGHCQTRITVYNKGTLDPADRISGLICYTVGRKSGKWSDWWSWIFFVFLFSFERLTSKYFVVPWKLVDGHDDVVDDVHQRSRLLVQQTSTHIKEKSDNII